MDSVEPFLQEILSYLNLDSWEVSVLFCDDSYIAELNEKYRNIEGPTDILSFEQGDEYIAEDGVTWFTAGDLLVSTQSLADNAERFNVSLNEELKRLLVHGILHLNGMDHSSNEPEEPMLQAQEKILVDFSQTILIKEK